MKQSILLVVSYLVLLWIVGTFIAWDTRWVSSVPEWRDDSRAFFALVVIFSSILCVVIGTAVLSDRKKDE